jgi:hypothetical protein
LFEVSEALLQLKDTKYNSVQNANSDEENQRDQNKQVNALIVKYISKYLFAFIVLILFFDKFDIGSIGGCNYFVVADKNLI